MSSLEREEDGACLSQFGIESARLHLLVLRRMQMLGCKYMVLEHTIVIRMGSGTRYFERGTHVAKDTV
jgi:hypothetical protein